jgi:ABC-2 type transport system ATP-binding protein
VTAAIRAEHVVKSFGPRAVITDLTLDISPGAAFGLLGPNGAGKTTTVRLLTGLLAADAGAIDLLGERLSPANADRLRERIGVQTDTALYETLTVRDNLRTWGDLYDVAPARRDRRIDDLLGLLGLDGRADSLVGELSKGMRQKLAVARAVLHEPALLFLDEPTAGLDPEASADLVAYLRRLVDAGDTTLVLCTHQLFGLENLCTDVGILDGGRLAVSGAVDDVLHERWPRPRIRIVAGDPDSTARAVAGLPDVTAHSDPANPSALIIEVPTENAVPPVVAALVDAGLPVHAVEPLRPTLEDLYFATVTAREGALA